MSELRQGKQRAARGGKQALSGALHNSYPRTHHPTPPFGTEGWRSPHPLPSQRPLPEPRAGSSRPPAARLLEEHIPKLARTSREGRGEPLRVLWGAGDTGSRGITERRGKAARCYKRFLPAAAGLAANIPPRRAAFSSYEFKTVSSLARCWLYF